MRRGWLQVTIAILIAGMACLGWHPVHAQSANDRGTLGKSSFAMPERYGTKVAPLVVHLYRPEKWTLDAPVLFVMHGRQRNGAEYRDQWVAEGDRHGLLIVVPEFDNANFPGTAAYNWGGVVDEAGKARPAGTWAFGVIDDVFDAVRQRTGARRERYALYGHSAGAQFVHRLLLMARSARAEAIVTANAGSYTMPAGDVAFPFGLGGSGVSDADLKRAFGRPVTVLLGDADTDPDSKSLPRQPGAMAQGPHRFARGQLFFKTAREKAAELSTPFAWKLVTVEGVGHSNSGMARKAADLIAAVGH